MARKNTGFRYVRLTGIMTMRTTCYVGSDNEYVIRLYSYFIVIGRIILKLRRFCVTNTSTTT